MKTYKICVENNSKQTLFLKVTDNLHTCCIQKRKRPKQIPGEILNKKQIYSIETLVLSLYMVPGEGVMGSVAAMRTAALVTET